MAFPERLDTKRLLLRRWREEDRASFLSVWLDPDVWRALRPEVPPDPGFAAERFDHHLGHWDRHGFGLLAVEERESGAIAGWIGPAHPSSVFELAEAVEVGWALRRGFWGCGLATEGARAAIDAAFAHLDRDELISLIHPRNERSAAVAERLGMSRTDRLHRTAGGDPVVVYAIVRPAR